MRQPPPPPVNRSERIIKMTTSKTLLTALGDEALDAVTGGGFTIGRWKHYDSDPPQIPTSPPKPRDPFPPIGPETPKPFPPKPIPV
jgi:hypothetical protein